MWPFLDVLERLRVAVDAVNRHIIAPLAPQCANGANRRIVPATPDGKLFRAGRVTGKPGIGVLRAVLEISPECALRSL